MLKRAAGVIEAHASFIRGVAVVKYDASKVTPKELVDLINSRTFYRASLPKGQVSAKKEKISYAQVELLGLEIPLEANLALREIGIALKGVKGIYDFTLSEDGKGQIAYDPEIIAIADIRKIATFANSKLKGLLPIKGIKIVEKEAK